MILIIFSVPLSYDLINARVNLRKRPKVKQLNGCRRSSIIVFSHHSRKLSLYHYSQACFNKQRPPSCFLLSPRLHSDTILLRGLGAKPLRRNKTLHERKFESNVMLRCKTYLEISVSRRYSVAIQVKTLLTG